jgi:hypothetical protein
MLLLHGPPEARRLGRLRRSQERHRRKECAQGHSYRFNNKLECLSIGLSQADFVRHKYFPEMTHKIAEVPGPIQMVCPIGVGEGVKGERS